MPDLSGAAPFPNDNDRAGHRRSTLRPGRRPTATTAGTRARSADHDQRHRRGGRLRRRADPCTGSTAARRRPTPARSSSTTEGEHDLEFRAVDRAGNAEALQRRSTLKVDPNAPTTTATVYPGEPLGADGWHDGAVTLRLTARDGPGSGADEHASTASTAARVVPLRRRRSRSTRRARTSSSTAPPTSPATSRRTQVAEREGRQATAPMTTVLINGAAPGRGVHGRRAGRVHPHRRRGLGAVETEYRLDGGEWTPYDGRVRHHGLGGYRVDFRSTRPRRQRRELQDADRSSIRPPRPRRRRRRRIRRRRRSGARAVAARGGGRASARPLSRCARGRFAVQRELPGRRPRHADAGRRPRDGAQAQAQARDARQAKVRCGDEGRATVSLRPAEAQGAWQRSKARSRAKLTLRMQGAAAPRDDAETVTFRGKTCVRGERGRRR